ncbi:MAG TPA: hypothetical protein VF221_07030, partial [Chloroflexota bacterium]
HAAGVMHSSPSAARTSAQAPLRLALFTSPRIVNVGQFETVSVAAPIPSSVTISFRSAHHAFTGMAVYRPSTRLYVLSFRLIPRVHSLEGASVVATVHSRATGRTYKLFGRFQIRGETASSGGIPQNGGGDGDGDNFGGPSDGDGNR